MNTTAVHLLCCAHRVHLGRALAAAVGRLRRPQGVAHDDVLPRLVAGLPGLSLQEAVGLERFVFVEIARATVSSVEVLVPRTALLLPDQPPPGRRARSSVAHGGHGHGHGHRALALALARRRAAACWLAIRRRRRMRGKRLSALAEAVWWRSRRQPRLSGCGCGDGLGARRAELGAAAACEAAVDEHRFARHGVPDGRRVNV